MLLHNIVAYRFHIQRRALQTAYSVYPFTNAEEQEKQACYLTKTVLNDGYLSSKRIHSVLNELDRDQMVESVKKKIIEVNYFHRDQKLTWKKMTPPKMVNRIKARFRSEFGYHIVWNMLRTLWSNPVAKKCGLSSTNFSHQPDVSAPWQRDNHNIFVSGKLGHLIQGKTLLPVFANHEQVENTKHLDVIWDDIISPFFDLKECQSNLLRNSGFYEGAPYSSPQTLLLLSKHFKWPSRMHTGQAVFYTFAHAMNYALNNGEKMGEDLNTPVPMQCVTFDGTSFFFLRYQLNTLNLDDSKNSLKNIAWITSDVKLYDEVTDKHSESTDFIEYIGERTSLVDFDRKRLATDLKDEQSVKVSLEGFDRDAVDMFIDFMLYPHCEEITG